jgi:hypothetical protein
MRSRGREATGCLLRFGGIPAAHQSYLFESALVLDVGSQGPSMPHGCDEVNAKLWRSAEPCEPIDESQVIVQSNVRKEVPRSLQSIGWTRTMLLPLLPLGHGFLFPTGTRALQR